MSTPDGPRRAAVAVVAGVLTLLLAGAVFLLYSGRTGTGPSTADGAVLADFLAVRTPDLTTGAVLLTTVGSTAAMAVLAAVGCLWLWLRDRRVDAVFLAAAALGGSAVFRLLKSVLDRARPPAVDRLVNETNESLPSGHATMSVVVIGALVVLAWERCGPARRAAIVTVAAVWVGAVGATRLYLGVHWFSDVLAGWLVGATWLALCAVGRSWWRRRSRTGAGSAEAGAP